jgi:hypothetical protein
MGHLGGNAVEEAGVARQASFQANAHVTACRPAATQCGERHVSLRVVIEAIIP